jgi:hypothetical protein
MFVRAVALFVPVILLSHVSAQEGKFSIKPGTTPAPKELAAGVQKLLGKSSIQLLDEGGKVVGEFWFRSEIPADATPEQIKNGITWREVKQSEVIGAVRFEQDWTDYRKQKVKAGVYTLRLGYQPSDGDHQGSSEFQDFLLLVAADKDKKPELLDVKHMVELSGASIGATHPGVFMLAPNAKGVGPGIIALPRSHWVLQAKSEITVAGKQTGKSMGIGLNVVGHAE